MTKKFWYLINRQMNSKRVNGNISKLDKSLKYLAIIISQQIWSFCKAVKKKVTATLKQKILMVKQISKLNMFKKE